MLDQIGNLFGKMNAMVATQEEMLIRIDHHAEEAEENVKKGKKTVYEIFKDVSSNRKCIFQLFFFLICFSVMYIVFFS